MVYKSHRYIDEKYIFRLKVGGFCTDFDYVLLKLIVFGY